MVNRVVEREKLGEATMWLASRVALNDLLALKKSKVSVNQAADIMGQSAAVRASGNFWLMSRDDDAERRAAFEAGESRVAWSKVQNDRFRRHEEESDRPW